MVYKSTLGRDTDTDKDRERKTNTEKYRERGIARIERFLDIRPHPSFRTACI